MIIITKKIPEGHSVTIGTKEIQDEDGVKTVPNQIPVEAYPVGHLVGLRTGIEEKLCAEGLARPATGEDLASAQESAAREKAAKPTTGKPGSKSTTKPESRQDNTGKNDTGTGQQSPNPAEAKE